MANKKKLEVSGGNGAAPQKPSYKVSKIMAFPTRKVNLGNYSSIDLSAGFEIIFDEPQDVQSPQITEAFTEIRDKIKTEFRLQMDALGRAKKNAE